MLRPADSAPRTMRHDAPLPLSIEAKPQPVRRCGDSSPNLHWDCIGWWGAGPADPLTFRIVALTSDLLLQHFQILARRRPDLSLLNKGAAAQFGYGFAQLRFAVHNDRAIPGHRLFDGLS